MKKYLLSSLLSIFVSFNLFSQDSDSLAKDSSWAFSGISSLNFSQVYMSNWAAGGQQSIAGNALLNLSADYKKSVHSWENDLILGYGIVKIGDEKHQKSDDKIDLTSKYGREAFAEHWYYSALVNFKSQFAPGYNYPDDTTLISDFLSPAYGLFSLGLDYQRGESFSFYVSPFTAKVTLVMNDSLSDVGAYGVDPGEKILVEFGAYVKLEFTKELMKNVVYQTRLELFSSYTNDPSHIDVLWDNMLAMTINKYISANITTSLIYDHDIDIAVDNNDDGIDDSMGPRTQFKEAFSLGIQYTFKK